MRIKMTVSYDGTDFFGWQLQKKGETVQGEIEKALLALTGEAVRVTGSGRTDSGVHAIGQVCHFDVKKTNIPPEKYKVCLNNILPQSIRIIKSQTADNNFNARFSAVRKTYIYSMYISDVILPLKDRYALRIDGADVDAMNDAAQIFLGRHDFAAYCASGSSVKDTVREIYGISVVSNGSDIRLEVTGGGFLYNMVRIMAGVLLYAGQGKASQEDIKNSLILKRRPSGVKTLAARGLTLKSVEYF